MNKSHQSLSCGIVGCFHSLDLYRWFFITCFVAYSPREGPAALSPALSLSEIAWLYAFVRGAFSHSDEEAEVAATFWLTYQTVVPVILNG
jgi:hypothetical protein